MKLVCFNYRRIIRIREMAFGEVKDTVQRGCDVVYMHSNDQENRASSVSNKCISHEQYTLENDLTLDEEDIFNTFNKNYKNEIRRAIKEGVKCIVIDQNVSIKNEISEFETIYNNMFLSKGMKNVFNRKLVEAGIAQNQLIITKAYIEEKDCVVYHAYLSDGIKTMLMYSASTLAETGSKEVANLIGWMNKYLHWYDMLWFKNSGYEKYEWGGINSITEPNGIARFKMGFGGKQKMYLNYLTASSLLGKLYIYMVKKKGNEWK